MNTKENFHRLAYVLLGMYFEEGDETRNHSIRVALYARSFAKYIGLNQYDTEVLEIAALLHDIGKKNTPPCILNYPGRLSKELFNIVKHHVAMSDEILKKLDFTKNAAPVVRAHHERWDGTGYPDGKKADEIPFLSRLLSLCDVFDALTAKRSYKEGMEVEDATLVILSWSQSQFDPKLVKKFMEYVKVETELVRKISSIGI